MCIPGNRGRAENGQNIVDAFLLVALYLFYNIRKLSLNRRFISNIARKTTLITRSLILNYLDRSFSYNKNSL